MLTRVKIEVNIERRVLSNLIMSTPLLAKCRSNLNPLLFESTMGRIVSTWVVDFFDRHGEAPGKTISDIYRLKASELQDADSEMVCTFLSSCSDEWLPTNLAYSEDMVIKYFQQRSLAVLAEKLTKAVQSNDISSGMHAVSDFIKPEIRQADVVDMFRDASTISNAFENVDEELFTMPGELGSVIGPFIKEDFIAFIGPPKSGKTWWLMAVAVQAALQGRHVLFVSLEMSKVQMVRRFWQMLTGTSRYGEEVNWPYFEFDNDGVAHLVDGRQKTEKVDSSKKAIEDLQKTIRKMSRGGRLELRNYPTGTLSVRGLEAEIKDMEVYEGFIPEVVCVDYADIMDLGPGSDERDKVNKCWKSLRGLASKLKGMVATVSQTGRETIGGKKDASENAISEDIRKVAHVTKMMTINHTLEEKERGIVRMACNTSRDGAPVNDQVVCTSCLSIGRPYLECQRLSNVDMGKEEEWQDESSDDYAPSSSGRRTASRTRGRR